MKKAVVAGGTHGMGLAIVRELLARGAEVVLTGRNERNVEEARTALKGEAAHVVRSDAASMADIAALGEPRGGAARPRRLPVRQPRHRHFAELAEVTEEAWDRHFAVNTRGAFFTVQRLAPLLVDGGAVVFTTVANDVVFPGLSAYSRGGPETPSSPGEAPRCTATLVGVVRRRSSARCPCSSGSGRRSARSSWSPGRTGG